MSLQSLFPCPACGFLMVEEPAGSRTTCSICGWEERESNASCAERRTADRQPPGAAVLPSGFQRELRRIHESVRDIDGWLTDREIDFLALLAAYPTAAGEILELGSYRGRSTITLAQGARLSDQATVVTVDPDADEQLKQNLRAAGVGKCVEVYKAYSWDLIAHWKRPIRLLWHDGANTYETVTRDIELLQGYLQDFAIVAFHDVLNPSGERIAVFVEQILDSDHFAAVGVCGSIGWGQFHRDVNASGPWREAKQALRRKLKPLVPYQSTTQAPPGGLSKIRYRLLRSRVPHGRVDPETWIAQVSTGARAGAFPGC